MENQPEVAYHKLETVFSEMRSIAENWTEEQLFTPEPAVSQWSAAQQIVHTMAATGGMLKAIDFLLAGRGPIVQTGEANRVAKMIFRSGRMPRGKAKAPDRFVPTGTLTRAEVLASITRSRERFDALQDDLHRLADVPGRIEHPFLSNLNAVEWLLNAQIHAEHHLAIIHDIETA